MHRKQKNGEATFLLRRAINESIMNILCWHGWDPVTCFGIARAL